MNKCIALLRAVNVGGTGKLPMADLRKMCTEAGFENVQTYIASGNLVFDTALGAKDARTTIEKLLEDYTGKPVPVFVLNPAEMKRILEGNPFPDREGRFVQVIFLDSRPPKDALTHASGVKDEVMKLGKREIYVYYPSGMGRSKLKIPAAKDGTARNMNTVTRLVEMSQA